MPELPAAGLHRNCAFEKGDPHAPVDAVDTERPGTLMEGSWGFPGTRGRYMHVKAERIGGVAIEFPWNGPPVSTTGEGGER